MKNIERLAIESVIYENVPVDKGRDDMLVALRKDANRIALQAETIRKLRESVKSAISKPHPTWCKTRQNGVCTCYQFDLRIILAETESQ